mmetsp:Transcript_16959/g.23599  ORF Transcript_16959/g.23599 Transcript_16959/m.23599 type:complete len:168 (+) Transcript_16959:91-594(+)
MAVNQSTKHAEECVWDYPRPPALEKLPYRLQVIFNGETIADTTRGYRVLETSHPPTYYFPREDIKMEYLKQSEKRQTWCEFKGMCTYYHVNVNGKEQKNAAWAYIGPVEKYKPMDGYISFYCSKMDECYVDGERATPQQSEFYGGWVTSWINGGKKGFKGPLGTEGW